MKRLRWTRVRALASGPILLALTLALSGIAPAPVLAQDAVDLWGAWGSWAGKNARTFHDGYALGASYVADVGRPVDLGIDIGFARFGTDQVVDMVDELEVTAVLRRWVWGRESAFRPFLGARLGYTRLSADLADLRFEQNGAIGGLVLGFVLPTDRTLSPMFSVEALRLRYNDTTAFLEDIEVPQTGGWGWRFFVRGGVTFGSGWKRRPR